MEQWPAASLTGRRPDRPEKALASGLHLRVMDGRGDEMAHCGVLERGRFPCQHPLPVPGPSPPPVLLLF